MIDRYDVIGSGAGPGTLTHALARTGKRILLLDTGGFLPRAPQNRDSKSVWVDLRYQNSGAWTDADTGEEFAPKQNYGLAFSPDEQTLYVTDSGANQEPGSYHVQRPHRIVAFDVLDGRHLGPGRLFAVTTPGFPDGIKTDRAGRVYASSFSGVQVFSVAGDLIGQIRLPGAVNFTFGGPGGQALFITTDTAVWAAVLTTAGAGQRKDQGREGGDRR